MRIREMLAEIQLSYPYAGFELEDLRLDLQGWGSEHPWFQTLVEAVKPRQIIEVGTWKGASAITLARHALAFEPEVTVLCIDTWLGSNEILWSDPELRPLLKTHHGYPTIYRQFLANIIYEKLTETIFPLPMTSPSAAELLRKFKVEVDLIYIDAGHSEYEVYGDLTSYYGILRSGGIMFGDDYWNDWSGVIKAVDRFARERQLELETNNGKWFVTKLAV